MFRFIPPTVLNSLKTYCVNLTSLRLSQRELGIDALPFFAHVQQLTRLDASLQAELVQQAATCWHKMTILSLWGSLLTDSTIRAIAINCNALTKLDLSCAVQITDASLIAISEHLTSLTELTMIGIYHVHHVTDVGMEALARMPTKLERLQCWRFVNITPLGVLALARQSHKYSFAYCDKLNRCDLYNVTLKVYNERFSS